jgi:hypothetical protein
MGFFSKSAKLEKLEKRIDAIEEENEAFRATLSEVSNNLIDVNNMAKLMITAQQQVSVDMNIIYEALQQVIGTANNSAVDPLEEYLVRLSPFGSDDDDGGLLN